MGEYGRRNIVDKIGEIQFEYMSDLLDAAFNWKLGRGGRLAESSG